MRQTRNNTLPRIQWNEHFQWQNNDGDDDDDDDEIVINKHSTSTNFNGWLIKSCWREFAKITSPQTNNLMRINVFLSFFFFFVKIQIQIHEYTLHRQTLDILIKISRIDCHIFHISKTKDLPSRTAIRQSRKCTFVR